MIPDRGSSLLECPTLVYHQFQMRRGISIFLIPFFWLGPLAAMLPSSAASTTTIRGCSPPSSATGSTSKPVAALPKMLRPGPTFRGNAGLGGHAGERGEYNVKSEDSQFNWTENRRSFLPQCEPFHP